MDTRLNSFYKDNLHPFVGAMLNVLIESGRRGGRPAWLTALYRNTNRKFDEDNETLRRVAQEVVGKRRRAGQSEKKDLLDAMLSGKDPATGKGLTDQSIMDNMKTFLMAGQSRLPSGSQSMLTGTPQGTKQLLVCWASSLGLSYNIRRLTRRCRKKWILSLDRDPSQLTISVGSHISRRV